MKKYGKYERMPDGSRAKQPEMKSVLLQTYFTSLVCLLLCVTMFFGTTYAWFTSEVTNTGNEIYIGVLDVELMKQIPDSNDEDTEPDFVSLSGKKDDGSNTYKLFGDDVRWEPGYTALETVKIVDKGDLAFNYELTFTDGKIDGKTEDELMAVAKWFDVWVFDHQQETAYSAPVAYADITAEDSAWTEVGTLAEVLAGKTVISGGMDTTDVIKENDAEHTYTIALHMNGEDAAEDQQETLNALMGQKIELSVKLVATQRSSETDGFGSGIYDAGTVVTNEEELRKALKNGGTVVLAVDIELTESIEVPSDVSAILDLNSKTISQNKECTETYSMIENRGKLTITGNGKLVFTDTGDGDSDVRWATYTIRNSGTLIIDNGTIEHLGTQTYNGNNAIFNYIGDTTINGGSFNVPYSRTVRLWNGSLTINGGDFDGQVWVQAMSDCTLTITGGSFKPATNGNDVSSVFITNDTYDPSVSISGGNFDSKIGCSDTSKLWGCITGGVFTEDAKANTEATLFADSQEEGAVTNDDA